MYIVKRQVYVTQKSITCKIFITCSISRVVMYVYELDRYSLRPEISVVLKFQFAFEIWCLSLVIFRLVLVQLLQGGGAGVWGVISFKEFLRCILYVLFNMHVEYLFKINIFRACPLSL